MLRCQPKIRQAMNSLPGFSVRADATSAMDAIRSALTLYAIVESGYPADRPHCLAMRERQRAYNGKASVHAFQDGSYASRDYLESASTPAVRHAAFGKNRGWKREEMNSTSRPRKQPRRFHSSVKARICWLRLCFGLVQKTAMEPAAPLLYPA